MREPGEGGVSTITFVPDVYFNSATQLIATKNFVYAVAAGGVGDLARSAGMAGDDSVAHSFAAKYEPAAATIINGVSASGQAIGLTAAKLLGLAVDFLNAEDAAARLFTSSIDTSSYAGGPRQAQCDPQRVAAALPMVTGSAQIHEMPVIGRFWPQGNPDALRDAASTWAKLAGLVDEAQVNAGQHVGPIPIYCSGESVTAVQQYVAQIYTPSPSGSGRIDPARPLMENVSAACRNMSEICHEYADAIDTCRNTLIGLAVGAGIITVAGVVLTIFTLGGSDAAAAAGDAALAGEAAVAAEALATAEAELAATAVVAEAEQVIAAALARLAAAGVITATVVFANAGATDAAPVLSGALTAVPATVPPLPPGPPSGAFPPYSAPNAGLATAWYATLPTRDPVYGQPDDIAYQIRVAGEPEILVATTAGAGKWADGYRPSDGAIIDAKHVRDLGCSPRTLDGLNEGEFASIMFSNKDQQDITQYASAVANPANHIQYLEIDTDDPETVAYWEYLAAQNHVPADVRYIP